MRHSKYRIRHSDFAEVDRALRIKNRRQAFTTSPQLQELKRLRRRMAELDSQLKAEHTWLSAKRFEMDNFLLIAGPMGEKIGQEWLNIIDAIIEDVKRKIKDHEQELDGVSRKACWLARMTMNPRSSAHGRSTPTNRPNRRALAA